MIGSGSMSGGEEGGTKIKRRGREKPTTAVIGGESTSDKTKREILRCLADKQVARIGVQGMGGIGKTTMLEHVHNGLLKPGDEIGSNFDTVIWVTASKATGIRGLQEKIGIKLELGSNVLRDEDNEEIRANILSRELKKKSFVLIIDDLWDDYSLEKVGVPNPTPENGCKLVITTRSRGVCSKMRCDHIIDMGFLSEEEAIEFFFDKVGKGVASDPKLGEIARKVALECQGLPLAIVTVARSMRDKSDPREWKVASDEITRILKFSYDRLNDEHKACILHCALYKEDHLIPRDLLADQLIALESVERGRTTKEYKFDKCHVMLNGLVRDCLLMEAVNDIHEKCVKLHDSVRDMAIQIMRETPTRFLVEDVASLEGEKWYENLEKVSLTGVTETLSLGEPRESPRLSTLFLNVGGLENIMDDFFAGMKRLCVLDLSNTLITRLPRSVVELENISVLSLKDCYKLKSVPDLSKLKNLTRLDLYGVNMKYFPQGIEKLVKLAYLDLGNIKAQTYPKGFLSKLTKLRYLSIVLPESAGVESAEELATLNKLETLKVVFMKLKLFRSYFKSARPVPDSRFDIGSVCYVKKVPKSVSLNCDLLEDDDGSLPIAIPNNVEKILLFTCNTSLCRLIFVKDMKNLQRLELRKGEMEYMLYHSPTVIPLLSNITKLELYNLENLRALISHEGDGTASPAPLPLGAFFALKYLRISLCPALKTVFVVDKESSLPHLKDLDIMDCLELKEIIRYEDEDAMKMELPALKSLSLFMLPKLKSAEFVANSLSRREIRYCPELKKVDSSLQPFIEELCLKDCDISVCRLISVEDLKNRHRLVIERGRMEYMILYSPAVLPLLSNITELELYNLPKLRALMGHEGDGTASPAPLPLAAFSALKELTISECDALKTVFVVDKESSLPHLEEVKIEHCKELEEIIRYEDEGDGAALPLEAFSALKKLTISECHALKIVFVIDKEASFPHLEELVIKHCKELEEIMRYEDEGDGTAPLPLAAFSALKKLTISECDALKTVFVVDKVSSLPHLEELFIIKCKELEEIIRYEDEDAIRMELPALKTIKLSELPNLKSAEFVANSLLRGDIRRCPELKKVDSSLQPFIDELFLNDCDISVCRLISVEDMRNLESIVISGGRMEYMIYDSPAVLPLLSNITELELYNLPKLRALIGHEGDGTASPAPLPLAAFSALKKLTIVECPALKTVFVVDNEASLPHLELLVIYECAELEEIIAYEDEDAMRMELPTLKSITLINLPKLKSAEFVANSLSRGDISRCPELKKVASSLQPFVIIDSVNRSLQSN